MLYADYLKTLTQCPFCSPEERVIKESKLAFLTYSIAPYSQHHILVLPKRHVESLFDLMEEENQEIATLLQIGARLLQSLGHTDFSILVRNGDSTGKSIKHLHYNLVPKIHIGNIDHGGAERKVLAPEEISSLMNEFIQLLPKT